MYRVELNEPDRYNNIAFVFKEYDEASDFICMAMGRSVEELKIVISEVREEK